MKDYEPTEEYKHKLDQLSRAIGPSVNTNVDTDASLGKRGIWQSLVDKREKRDSLALTRVLTSHEAAMNLDSPRGLMLHGEVGTGKSMLIDLFADCLPNKKKARWHFNTFMLDTFAKLEQLRRNRLSRIPPHISGANLEEHSLLCLARDMINSSPILFLDEFQLPDRAASKIMTNLMTSFFQLGGVLIATSNRMPEELHKAAGMAFPPPSRLQSITQRLGMGRSTGRSENMFAGQGEFAGFLEVLKARCEVWEMISGTDYRRHESNFQAPPAILEESRFVDVTDADAFESDSAVSGIPEDSDKQVSGTPTDAVRAPTYYFINPGHEASEEERTTFQQQVSEAEQTLLGADASKLAWSPSSMRVYGRNVPVPRSYNGTSSWTFTELCASNLGPADYITLASTYHTIILHDVPTLSLLQKNEARRFITLLDALYEARCKLLITASAGPDETFFPEKSTTAQGPAEDAVYAETFAEAYQDATAPFRPNISSQTPEYTEPEPDYTHDRLRGMLAADSLEDDPPNRVRRLSERERGPIDPDDDMRMRGLRQGNQAGPDFSQSGRFTGEDERFAYRRAQSRLWEMCGRKWWACGEADWHRPLPASVRSWEVSRPAPAAVARENDARVGQSRGVDEAQDEVMFRHGASPFRTAREAPPKFSWTHVWGTVKWGKKAGAWGQGVEGLKDRKKEK